MFLVYFLAAVAVLKFIEYLINAALARRRPATLIRVAPIVAHTGPIIDITLGRTIGAWIVALPVDFFAGRFVHGTTEHRFFPGQLPVYVFFTAIILAATLTALRWSRRLFRYGRSFVRVEPADAVVGGPLKGTLHIPRRLPSGAVVHLELTCTRTSKSGANNDLNIRHVVEYDKERDIDPRSSVDLIGAIPFEFPIPHDATPTTATHKLGFFRISYAWALTASSTTPGVDYWAKFAIPITAAPLTGEPIVQQ